MRFFGRVGTISCVPDLIFAFAEPGETQGVGKSKTNDQFFASLCRKYLNVLGQTVADGPLFRVDARLRPYGDNGPLVMSFEVAETYYESQGREWERYAWIKGRCVAGDFGEENRLLAALKPFIDRRYLDYGAFESFRDMKRMIAMEIRKKGVKDNIKLGRGGIADGKRKASGRPGIRLAGPDGGRAGRRIDRGNGAGRSGAGV